MTHETTTALANFAGPAGDEGSQSVPVNWEISPVRKRAFHQRVAAITGASQR